MKARIKATGEYIEVEQRGSTFLNTNDGSLYNVKELDLNIIDDVMSEQEKWYWKDKHIQAAIAAMLGMVISDAYCSEEPVGPAYQIKRRKWPPEKIVQEAVTYADFLIAELQKKGGQDE